MKNIFALLFCLLISVLNAQTTTPKNISNQHNYSQEPINGILKYDLTAYNGAAILEGYDSKSKHDFNFVISEELKFEAWIIETNIVGDDFLETKASTQQTLKKKSNVRTFRGEVKGGGQLRLTIAPNFTYGYVEMNNTTYYFEPAAKYFTRSKENELIVYDQRDVEESKAVCGWKDSQNKLKSIKENANTDRSFGNCYEIELAVAADFLMYQKYGNSTTGVENYIIGIMNNVEGLYTGNFDDDIEFNIVTFWISDCNTCDPWSPSTDAETFLISFRIWGNGGGFGVGFDLADLWTNRDFDGATVGLAYVGVLCTSFKYAVLEDFSTNANLIITTVAHETGHNLNADHDPSGSTTIMAPVVGNFVTWSTLSKNVISSFIDDAVASGGCLSACPISGTPPVADFNAYPTDICPGSQVYFYDKSSLNATSWEWQFAGGTPALSFDQNPIVTYNNDGNYDVSLKVTNLSGQDTKVVNGMITVGDGGSSLVLYEDFDNGQGAWFIDNPDNNIGWTSTVSAGTFTGDGTMKLANFNYNNLGQRDGLVSEDFDLVGYTSAQLEIKYAYAASTPLRRDSFVVTISTDNGLNFNTTLLSIAETGSANYATRSPLTGAFEPNSESDWCGVGFGNDCLIIDMSAYLGVRNLVLKVENVTASGNDVYIDQIALLADCYFLEPPVADFNANLTEGCLPMVVQFTDESQNSPFAWSWSFDGGDPIFSSEENPQVIYLNAGVFDVSLQVQNDVGFDDITKTGFIVVNDVPQVDYSYSVNGLTVDFMNLTANGDQYIWTFGDGGSSNIENPSHTYSQDGEYDVTLFVTNACGTESIEMTILIETPVTAAFNIGLASGCAPLTVTFFNQSSDNVTDYQWFFEGGDPDMSSDEDPIIIYNTPGIYDVVLIAMNGTYSDTLIMTDIIEVQTIPIADFDYQINDLTVTFSDSSSMADDYLWAFGDGMTSADVSPTHSYINNGNYQVVLIVSNDCGQDTLSTNITVGSQASAGFISNVTSACLVAQVDYQALDVRAGISYAWVFENGNPSSSTLPNPVIEYSSAGTFDVSLTVTNALGMDENISVDWIEINGPPVSNFNYTVASNSTVDFEYVSTDFDWLMWDFGDGNSSDQSALTHVYSVDGSYSVTLTVANQCDTIDIVSQIAVYAAPDPQFTSDFQVGCAPFVVQYTNETQGPDQVVEWTFQGGTPASSFEENPIITYEQAGEFNVQLLVTGPGGSTNLLRQDFVNIVAPVEADFSYNHTITNVAIDNNSQYASQYRWLLDGIEFSLDSMPLFPMVAIGDYELMLIAVNGYCADTMTQTVTILPSAIEDQYLDQMISLLPNPNNGQFRLTSAIDLSEVELIIYDLNGKEIPFSMNPTGKVTHIDLDVNAGVYFMILQYENRQTSKKIIVIRE